MLPFSKSTLFLVSFSIKHYLSLRTISTRHICDSFHTFSYTKNLMELNSKSRLSSLPHDLLKNKHRDYLSKKKETKIGSKDSSSTTSLTSNQAISMDIDDTKESSVNKLPTQSSDKFESLDITDKTMKAILEKLNYRIMTPVQIATIPALLNGVDAVVKAKTGTGKTVAFLIPAIEILLKERIRYMKNQRQIEREVGVVSLPKPIVLVISPTRELALQTADEARNLCTFHDLTVVTLVGGTNVNTDERAITRPVGVDIVVGTPGRLLLHLKETPGFSKICAQTKFLVLDEADRLIDEGFKKDVDKIMAYLAAPQIGSVRSIVRQTLLCSATFSDKLREIATTGLRSGYSVIDTVGEDVDQTHVHVAQSIIVSPMVTQIDVLAQLISQQRSLPLHKVIVFFPTARHAGYLAELFNAAEVPVLEIHSRKSQAVRTRVSTEFRSASSAILFSSDVIARGMDYPDVTLVIQVGITTKDQYIHRLGRTARAGKTGNGVILCSPEEEVVLRSELSDFPLVARDATNFTSSLSADQSTKKSQVSIFGYDLITKIDNVLKTVPHDDNLREKAGQAWAAWLGFCKSYINKVGWTPSELVAASAVFARTLGLNEIPGLPRKIINKMGLSSVDYLLVSDDEPKTKQKKSGPSQPSGSKSVRYNSNRDNGNQQTISENPSNERQPSVLSSVHSQAKSSTLINRKENQQRSQPVINKKTEIDRTTENLNTVPSTPPSRKTRFFKSISNTTTSNVATPQSTNFDRKVETQGTESPNVNKQESRNEKQMKTSKSAHRKGENHPDKKTD